MHFSSNAKKTPVTLLALSIGLALQAQAFAALAQDADQAPVEQAPSQDASTLGTVTVTGYRASLEKAVDIKRSEAGIVDAIVAEDIADFPDLNLAESLQRIPGVSITREGGEGRNISVRGLGPQFTRVRINGVETIATTGGTDTSGGVNRGRSFDFNTFASELFSQLVVRKTSSAEIPEGSLGATVDLRTARPFDFDDFTMAIGGQMGYSDLAGEYNPRGTFLISNTFADNKLGALLSVAYTDRTVLEEGSDTVRWSAASANGGFSPGSTFAVPGTAYHPRIPRYNRYLHEQDRLGVTTSVQFRPNNNTELVFDGLFARFNANRWQDNINAVAFSAAGANGKPGIIVRDGFVDSTGSLVYGVFDNVRLRSEGRYDEQTTEFEQWTWTLRHDFSDAFRLNALVGNAKSEYDNPIQTTVIADKLGVSGYSYDYRGDRRLPVFNYGSVTPTDPTGWNLVEVRLRPYNVVNEFDTASLDLAWSASPFFTLKGGLDYKNFDFQVQNWGRGTPGGTRNEGNVAGLLTSAQLAELMRGYSLGNGQAGVVPDVHAFARALGIHDGAGRFAVYSNLTNIAADNRSVNELVKGYFVQGDFNFDIGPVLVRGNIGVRRADTRLVSDGWSILGGAAVQTRVVNNYSDTLSSLNIAAEFGDGFIVRLAAAEVMNRPDLGFLNPGATVSVAGSARTVTTGNPMLNPNRAKTLDLGFEWYFGDGAAVSIGAFYKDIDSYIQPSRETRPYFTSGLPESLIAGTGATVNDEFTFQQPLNTPGGDLKGVEIAYQQPFTFLPGIWADFGVQLNYTYVDSEIQYLSSTGAPTAKGPMLGLSNNAWNATVYYDNRKFSARISAAFRDWYANQIPGREGTDMEGTAKSTTVDASVSYNFNSNFSVSLEGLNLTDEWNDMWIDSTRDLPIAYTHTGRQYMVGFRYRF
jgi:iron complex outermembrane recepter protein